MEMKEEVGGEHFCIYTIFYMYEKDTGTMHAASVRHIYVFLLQKPLMLWTLYNTWYSLLMGCSRRFQKDGESTEYKGYGHSTYSIILYESH